ncbi:hypothetical protein K0T92_11925 [Paenibacillus oenotherae]|uniref:Uncharacterized protein n=1 Tax=Paenibacillus oenotherae TaxID=1435645 RepID=A0ABS7D6A6_9BACL|nr:hypothetical protein [Paenibacillus oenotherae]MBW7475458.1 hypothetical protein [Paenibacillus oenotherae]
MSFDFEKEFANDHQKIIKKLPSIILRAKEKNKDHASELIVAIEVLKVTFSTYIRILKKYEHYQLEKFQELEKRLDK